MPDKQIYYRLVALWVICEAFLGGIIHGLKLPISGLIVGGAATICICLIANYYPQKGAILKATLIVAIFKMMLSPQSPLPAYVAVFFQGIVAETIFLNKGSYKFNCLLFVVIAMIESALQRLLIMTILFGMDIWKAIDIFINGITGQENVTKYSYYLAGCYVIVHLIAGLIIGWYAGKIPEKMNAPVDIIKIEEGELELNNTIKRKKKGKLIFILAWVILSGLFIQSLVDPSEALLPSNMIIRLILRSFLIVLTWTVLINPILIRILHRWLEQKKAESENDIKEIMMLLPVTQLLIQKSWNLSSREKGYRRLSLFFKVVVFNSLRDGRE